MSSIFVLFQIVDLVVYRVRVRVRVGVRVRVWVRVRVRVKVGVKVRCNFFLSIEFRIGGRV